MHEGEGLDVEFGEPPDCCGAGRVQRQRILRSAWHYGRVDARGDRRRATALTTSETPSQATHETSTAVTPVFEVTVSAGTLRPEPGSGVPMDHAWTDEGVVIEASFTGADFYLLSAASCILNDIYREAKALSMAIEGVRVRAAGAFDTSTWRSTGIEYEADIATTVDAEELDRLLRAVDAVAEIPKALRAGTTVARRHTG